MTTTNEYLQAVLDSQVLSDDSDEMKELRTHRDEVEEILRDKFGDASPTIRYGGSKAKGTLIKESYDLDIVCYFPSGEDGAGATLREIFENVQQALAAHYTALPKTSAIRLHASSTTSLDFHIDVVPGRFTDDKKGDCYLYQNGADKERLKTNLNVHIDLIRDAGVTPALRLLKLWRHRKGLPIKNFVWELLCIKLLSDVKQKPLNEQIHHVLQTVADTEDAIGIEDPANPQGNDVMPFLKQNWAILRSSAGATINQVATGGWESVFGQVETAAKSVYVNRLAATAAAVQTPTKPWTP